MMINKIIKKFIPKSHFEKMASLFKEDNKKHNLMANYDLNENSLIFDVGGYKGQGASDLFSMYLSTIYIFEPHTEYAKEIEKRFKKTIKLKSLILVFQIKSLIIIFILTTTVQHSF